MENRKIYLDYIRIIAIVLVLFNHLPGYYMYASSQESVIITWIYLSITMLTRINVPLFLMVSGAVLLGKTDNRKKWGLRILRYFILLFFLSLIMYVLTLVKFNSIGFEKVVQDFFYKFLNGRIEYLGSYWFLYAYLGMLCVLPLLRYIAKQMNKTDIIVLITLKIIFTSIMPIINFILMYCGRTPVSISANYQLPFVNIKELFYPLIGFYLAEQNIPIKTKISCVSAAVAGLFISSLLTYLQGIRGDFTQDYVQLFDYILAISVFILIKNIVEGKIWSNKSCVIIFSGLTFGIYLFDPFWKLLFGDELVRYLCSKIPDLMASAVWILLSITLGGVLTFILKKSKFISKLL
jgi:surface polysaccharide O-acyltransferase-like enzyme